MELIGPELLELSALELENLPYLTLFTLASANIDQSVPNFATIYMPIRSRMSSIMGQIKPEYSELFAFEFGKIAKYDQNCLSYLPLNLQKLLNLTLFIR